jgi:glycosyltransferase involved in cell wall biosynthesis
MTGDKMTVAAGASHVAPPRALDISATNIRGLGAVQLVASLLPALETAPGFSIQTIFLPEEGPLSNYRRHGPGDPPRAYRRWLPNAISRFLECTLFSKKVSGRLPLLVLGDLPVRHKAGQVILVHTPHLLPQADAGSLLGNLKYAVSRAVFRLNLPFISQAIVQTELMRKAMASAYPGLAGRLAIVAQPPPAWLLRSDTKRTGPALGGNLLSLFYPAAGYPHKNHDLLDAFAAASFGEDLVERIIVTIEPAGADGENNLLEHRGQLGPASMIETYAKADALLFPSLEESYGLPLIEAMYLGLPIVCADRDYAHALCGEGAIYFDPTSPGSLRAALRQLKTRLESGWWPDWSEQLASIPRDWDEVAIRMLSLFEIPAEPTGGDL